MVNSSKSYGNCKIRFLHLRLMFFQNGIQSSLPSLVTTRFWNCFSPSSDRGIPSGLASLFSVPEVIGKTGRTVSTFHCHISTIALVFLLCVIGGLSWASLFLVEFNITKDMLELQQILVVGFGVPWISATIWINVHRIGVINEGNGPESGGVFRVPYMNWFLDETGVVVKCEDLLFSNNWWYSWKISVGGSDLTFCWTDTRWWCWSSGEIIFSSRPSCIWSGSWTMCRWTGFLLI